MNEKITHISSSLSPYVSNRLSHQFSKKQNLNYTIAEISDEETDSHKEKVETVRGLKSRHIQLIALGGAIGAGMFVGSGTALADCGPAALLISYMIMSGFVWSVMNQLGEMVTFIPLPGEATAYALSRKYTSKSLSFTAGWNLFYAQAMIVPAEITACALVIQYWTDANSAIFITVFVVLSAGLNLLPVKYYGESEFWVASIKLLCITGLIIVGIVIFFGGGPSQTHVLGFHYWKEPGAFVEHLALGNTGKFLACWTAIIKSGFSFVLTPELITACSSESQNPRKNIPKACDRFVYRLAFFYILGVLVIGIVCASNDVTLLAAIAEGESNAAASPFVIGIINAGIKVLPHIVNACILTSAYSCGTSELYSASRVLYTMALKGDAPKIFSKVNKFGVPIYSVSLASLFPLLAYLNCSDSAAQVFTWLSNLATISGFFSWIFCSITYLRYRKVLTFHNLEDRVTYRPHFQKIGAYACIVFFFILSLTNGYAVFVAGGWSVSDFFASYVTFPIVIILYFGCMIYYREWKLFFHPSDIDILKQLERVEYEEEQELVIVLDTWYEKVWDFVA